MTDAVSYAREKRGSASVAFARFLEIRAILPDVAIAAIEGREDIGVWSVWFVRCGFEEQVEILPCQGKEKVFELKEIIRRNKRGSDDNVVFLIDRDYDDWAGNEPSVNVFITDRYSIENYFVCTRVLDHVLNNQFLCAGNPAEKLPIVQRFLASFEEYRLASDEVHRRTFYARRLRHDKGKSLPVKMRQIVEVTGPYQFQPLPVDAIPVDIPEGANEDALLGFKEEFTTLPFLERARGKYHRAFLQFFLQSLQDERRPENRMLFAADKAVSHFRYSALNFCEWAGVSTMPKGLDLFLAENFRKGRVA